MNADNRKGELSELKSQLRQLAGSRAVGVADVMRELYKKVISYMTIGIDVSSLFSEMVMCSATSDLVLKKMCYLYVCNYAVVNPELALLTINFLQKDCKEQDPMIRGLALRALCGLRVPHLVEYLVDPLRLGLQDPSAYVRQVAALGVLKLYQVAPQQCRDGDFSATLKRKLMHDPDTQVVANSLCALQEILTSEVNQNATDGALKEREILYSKPVVYALLNRIKEFSEWGQCTVLELAAHYIPSDSSETFDIMNLLEDRLQHANSAVVLATTKVFLHLTLSMADVHQQVYERIKAPLLTLMSASSAEQSFAVLSHLALLVGRAPMIFAGDYKHFYCRFSDPTYVKKLKLEMLTAVANENNTYEIVTELSEYVANVDVVIAREAVRAVGQIALQSYDVNGVVDRLLQFLEMDTDYVTAETLVLVKDLLRKYPQWSGDCIAVVGGVSSKSVSEPRGKCALLWMLGEYGSQLDDAPYVLEGLVEAWPEEEFPEVRLELLTAVAKLFLKRPPECQKLLGEALAAGLADLHQDVHDRALLYYRLFRLGGVEAAERVINPPRQAVNNYAEQQSSEAKDRIFDEFDTLAVIYRKPSYMFLDKEHRGPLDAADPRLLASPAAPASPPSGGVTFSENDNLLTPAEKEEEGTALPGPAAAANGPSSLTHSFNHLSLGSASSASSAAPPPLTPQPNHGHSLPVQTTDANATSAAAPASPSPAASVTPLDNFLGLGAPTNAPLAAVPLEPAVAEPPVPSLPSLRLSGRASLDAPTFQRCWSQLAVSQTLDEDLTSGAVAALTAPSVLSHHMAANAVQCMASGGKAPSFKFFFYACQLDGPPGGSLFLVELLVNLATQKATARIKSEDPKLTELFADSFRSTLARFGS